MNKQKLLRYSMVLFLLLLKFNMNAQTVTIAANPGTTGNGPMGSGLYHCSEHIYTQAEISLGACNAPYLITTLGYNMTTLLGGLPTTFTAVDIYLRTTTASTFTVAGTYPSTAGYTLVYSGPLTWSVIGFNTINLSTSFSYPNTPGTNLQMMVVRTNSSGNAGHVMASANGNNTSGTANTCRRYNSNAVPVVGVTAMGLTAFRASVRFGTNTTVADDAAVKNIYTLGKMPIEYGAPTTIQAYVTNSGTNTLTNLPVTLDITGTNTFTDVQTVASLAPGASVTVTFSPYSPAALSTNDVVTVSVPSDDLSCNNSSSWNMQITPNIYTYKNTSLPNAGGVGFTGFTGDFVAKFNSNIGQNYPYNLNPPAINEIKVDFAVGGQPYNVGIWDATGPGGIPGTLLWTSPSFTSAAGTAIITVPDIVVSGDYFVGVRQTGTTNVSFAYQSENPIRSQTFYFTSPTGSTTWTDFAPNSPFRFSIEVNVHIPVPPNCAINLLPADNTSIACVNPVLSWGNGGGGPTGYDVYLSTNSADVTSLAPAALVSANQAGTSYTPSLSPSTTYYWTIIPKNTDGDAAGCAVQSFTTGTLPNCYCVPVHNPICTGSLTNVQLNTLSNATTCSAPGYQIYPVSGSTTTSLEQASTYNLTVTTDTASIISVWIDYNQNGNFEINEWQQVTLASVANVPTVYPLTISPTALTGNTLMRIRTRFANNPNGATDPCTSFGSGESEDYVVTITPQPPCTGTPTPGNTVASATSACPNSTVNLSLQNATPGAGVTYQWEAADDLAFTTGLITLGTNSTETYFLTSDKYFRCNVTCMNSSSSAYSTPVLITVIQTPGSSIANPIVVGAPPCITQPYTNTQTNSTANCFSNLNGQASPEIYYQITLSAPATVNASHCGSGFDSYIHILDNAGNILFSNDDDGLLCAGTAASLQQTLAAGTYYVMSEGFSTNVGAITTSISTTDPCSLTLNLTAFLEGYVTGAGTMNEVLSFQGLPNPTTDCDDVTVELHDANTPYAMAHTFSGILKTNGTLVCTYPGSAVGNSYYIVVKNRNHMETWSAAPVSMTSTTAYNFSTAQSQAYGTPGNLVETPTGSGQWAMYSGDINQDLSIDAQDYLLLDPDIVAGNSGYLTTDLNGDGSVDALDYLILDPNISAGITIQAP